MTDKTFAHVIVQAFFSNLYYICVQLLNSLNNMEPWIYGVYFFFSLFYLIGRTVGMCLFGAEVHTETKIPAKILRRIPTEGWNVETERFLELVNNQTISLTGNGYFFITRPFLLSLLGTIVTYELVLMQFNENGSFHQAMTKILFVAQCFGVMPVIGVTCKNPTNLRFSWMSLRTIYSLISLVAIGFYTALTIHHSLNSKLEFVKVVPVIFYTSNLYCIFAFIRLAMQWPALMEEWKIAETFFNNYESVPEKLNLKRKVLLVAITVGLLSFIEHALSLATLIHYAQVCPEKGDPVAALFKQEFTQLFAYTKYSLEKGIFAQMINTVSTFVWSYMDCFVMLISVGLSTGFKKINTQLVAFKGKVVSEEFWHRHRTAYRRMCDLCENVDNHISRITLVSFSNNLFFICVQLLNSLTEKDSLTHTFYFWFSLLFLIVRTLAVSLYAAEINEQAKIPIHVFRVVPRESWCLEVKRFYEEVTNDIVALSGMKFFYLTRRLVLSVAGTIVTYELVLLQFHQDEEIENKDPCSPLKMA
ncbi:gustatory receptor for sugar taste 64f-like [Phlebotomus argentipes]|uniref:gustatory receptor for sugar taste 64f-like n=1 Tax=Phlebotomus argentipes TaxID=94469 RepID=UPI002892E3D9|nr:gustatory receptor for sugar taste 64f-like [Phlebotomus argentipes]